MKECVKCCETKGTESFNKNKGSKDGLHSYCRECHKLHYQNNKIRHKKNAAIRKKKYRTEIRIWLWFLKKNIGCVDCSFNDPRVLDFDHVRGDKEHNIGEMVSNGFSKEKIKEEISKCVVRCANCHRIKTWIQFGYFAPVSPLPSKLLKG